MAAAALVAAANMAEAPWLVFVLFFIVLMYFDIWNRY
jgi:hypothetical protein